MTPAELHDLLTLARFTRAERDAASLAERVRRRRDAENVITNLLQGPPERLRDTLILAEDLAQLLPSRRGAR